MLFAIVPRGAYFYKLFFTASSVSQHETGYIFVLSIETKNGGIELQCVDDQFRDEKKNKKKRTRFARDKNSCLCYKC